jgi:hypothetical protein
MDMRIQIYLGVPCIARFISLHALKINPADKSAKKFCSDFFCIRNEAKLSQGVSKDGKYHKLGDAPCIPLHQHKSRFANLQTLFYKHYIRVSGSLERLVFCFCFWRSISTFCRPPSVVRILEYFCASERKREKKKES